MTEITKPRSINAIAREIKREWKPVYYAACPYLDAMNQIETINDVYMHDPAKQILAYFLSNAGTWRGDAAKRIKAELNAMIKPAKKLR